MSMAENIIMPQLGESIAEGTIVKWLKNPGDVVKKDENILLISTDKVEAEIPSPVSGILLSVLVGPGKTVAVGTILGQVGQSSEASTEKNKKEAKPTETPTPTPDPVPATAFTVTSKEPSARTDTIVSFDRFLSPLVRKIASENQINTQELNQLAGSGRDNRITKKDILVYLETRRTNPIQASAAKFANTSSVSPAPLSKAPIVEFSPGQSEVIKPMSTMRRVIMENMLASRRASAHVTTFFEIDYTQIDLVRQKYKERFKQEENVPLTYTTFLAAAICSVLKRHPYINAEIQGDRIRFKRDVHLGIAVAIEGPEPGLMVPVIKNADQMNLRGLAHAIHDLAGRTRTKRIKPDELSGGSFTITNPGNYGAIIGTPIINQPQMAILGVGQIKKQAVVIEVNGTDCIGIRNMGWICLSFDHRLVDGATADIFMADLKNTLESWSTVP
jgi:pyruvate dehydrogenase E2 component (dihydrolipoamide acetyltransferase)